MPYAQMQPAQNEYERIVDALERGGYGPGKPSGKDTRFRCPVHERDGNHKPSLDVSEGRDGKALLQCRSQKCKAEDIFRALDIGRAPTNGWTQRASGNGKPSRRIVATYQYRDERGDVLYQAVRYEPKGFSQRRPDGKGGWEWKIDGCRKVPYRLPELLAAPKSESVYIVEGERDCDALAALGLVATTNAAGAGKFILLDPSTRADAFRDRPIVIIPDNDEPGRKHARQVAECLAGIAAGVWVCELPGLPVKGDVSDWLASGGTRDELLRLAEAAPSARKWSDGNPAPDADNATAAVETAKPRFKTPVVISQLVRPPQQIWTWEGFLKADGISLLSASWKVGKTTLLSRLLLAFGRGGEFLGLPIQKSNVLYITEENDGEWVERRDKLGIGDHVHILSQPWDFKPSSTDWQAWLEFVNGYRLANSIGVTVFDTVSTFWPIRNENDASEVNEALMPMRRLAKGQSVSVVHHLSKFDRGDGTGTRGSGALCGFVDVITEMRRFGKQGDEAEEGSEDDRRRVLTSYSRWDETPRKLVIRLRDDGLDFEAEGDGIQVKEERLIAELVKLLPGGEPGMTVDDAREALPESVRPKRAKVVQALQSGAAVGDWQASGTGKRGDPRRFWKPKNGFLSFPDPRKGNRKAVLVSFPLIRGGKGKETISIRPRPTKSISFPPERERKRESQSHVRIEAG